MNNGQDLYSINRGWEISIYYKKKIIIYQSIMKKISSLEFIPRREKFAKKIKYYPRE